MFPVFPLRAYGSPLFSSNTTALCSDSRSLSTTLSCLSRRHLSYSRQPLLTNEVVALPTSSSFTATNLNHHSPAIANPKHSSVQNSEQGSAVHSHEAFNTLSPNPNQTRMAKPIKHSNPQTIQPTSYPNPSSPSSSLQSAQLLGPSSPLSSSRSLAQPVLLDPSTPTSPAATDPTVSSVTDLDALSYTAAGSPSTTKISAASTSSSSAPLLAPKFTDFDLPHHHLMHCITADSNHSPSFVSLLMHQLNPDSYTSQIATSTKDSIPHRSSPTLPLLSILSQKLTRAVITTSQNTFERLNLSEDSDSELSDTSPHHTAHKEEDDTDITALPYDVLPDTLSHPNPYIVTNALDKVVFFLQELLAFQKKSNLGNLERLVWFVIHRAKGSSSNNLPSQ